MRPLNAPPLVSMSRWMRYSTVGVYSQCQVRGLTRDFYQHRRDFFCHCKLPAVRGHRFCFFLESLPVSPSYPLTFAFPPSVRGIERLAVMATKAWLRPPFDPFEYPSLACASFPPPGSRADLRSRPEHTSLPPAFRGRLLDRSERDYRTDRHPSQRRSHVQVHS